MSMSKDHEEEVCKGALERALTGSVG